MDPLDYSSTHLVEPDASYEIEPGELEALTYIIFAHIDRCFGAQRHIGMQRRLGDCRQLAYEILCDQKEIALKACINQNIPRIERVY